MARDSLKSVAKLITQMSAEEAVPVDTAFLRDLERSIELTDSRRTSKPSQTYKPSSMNCLRSMYYQVRGADTDPVESNYSLVGICNSGTDIHIRIQQAVRDMKSNGIDCEYIDVEEFVKSRNLSHLVVLEKSGMETKLFYPDLNMRFLCDGIIYYNRHYYVIELKTEASFKWSNRTGVDEAHYKQATAYSIAFRLPDVIFVYVNRDVLSMKSYLFQPTDEMKESLISTINECDGYVERGICPPKPDTVAKKTCSYCLYRTLCNRDAN